MIKTFTEEQLENLKIDIYLKDGRTYVNRDIPTQPFVVEGLVSFWVEGELMAVPIADIKSVNLYVSKN